MLSDIEQATWETISSVSGNMIDLNSMIDFTADRIKNRADKGTRFAVSIVLNDLLRSGILAFGNNDGAWNTDTAYLTAAGRKMLAQFSRDPINQNGYMKYLDEQLNLDAVARGYVEEALNTYRACCYKATAVLIGAAVEKLVLDLRDELVARLKKAGKRTPRELTAWQVKTVLESIAEVVLPDLKAEAKRGTDEDVRKLHEDADSRLLSIAAEFRRLRNDAGHPATLAPVEPSDVHANMLLFMSTARLISRLKDWVISYYV